MKSPLWLTSLALLHLFALLLVPRMASAVPMWNPGRKPWPGDEIATEFDRYFASAPAAESVEPTSVKHGVSSLDLSLHPPGQYDHQQGADTQRGRAVLHGSTASSHESEVSAQQPPRPFSRGFGFRVSDFATPASTSRPPEQHIRWGGAFQQAEGNSTPRSSDQLPSTSSTAADTSKNPKRMDETRLYNYRLRGSRDPVAIGNPVLLEAVRNSVLTRLNEFEGKLRLGPPAWRGRRLFTKEDIRIVPPASGAKPPRHAFDRFDHNHNVPHLLGGIFVYGYKVRFTEWRNAPDRGMELRAFNIVARKDSDLRRNEPRRYFLGAIYVPEEWTYPVQQSVGKEKVWVPVRRLTTSTLTRQPLS